MFLVDILSRLVSHGSGPMQLRFSTYTYYNNGLFTRAIVIQLCRTTRCRTIMHEQHYYTCVSVYTSDVHRHCKCHLLIGTNLDLSVGERSRPVQQLLVVDWPLLKKSHLTEFEPVPDLRNNHIATHWSLYWVLPLCL